jgi:hypothetical protein
MVMKGETQCPSQENGLPEKVEWGISPGGSPMTPKNKETKETEVYE